MEITPGLKAALERLEHFVGEVSGSRPTPEEVAAALKRYFVLHEINAQIVWDRDNPDQAL